MGMIIDGVFYKTAPKKTRNYNSEFKRWHHQDQRTTHKADIVQSFVQGKPNPDFIRLYPEESKMHFTEAQIREYGNK